MRRISRIVLPIGIFLLGVISAPAQDSEMVRRFDYDQKAPLGIKHLGVQRRAHATVYDITYASPKGGVVPAYLVVPKGRGPFAAIIWGHWYWGNRLNRQKIGAEKFDAFVAKYAWTDQGKYVSHAAPAHVFLQYATEEPFITPDRARQYAAVVSEPKQFKLYDAPHSLNAEARRDRIQFLIEQLGLKPVSEAQIASIRIFISRLLQTDVQGSSQVPGVRVPTSVGRFPR